MSQLVRTRFAPSPTGYLHLGTLRTALYTYLFARKHQGVFILRIEDTDQKREVKDGTQSIIRAMHTAGLQYDEGPDIGGDYGPYIQSQRKEIYYKYAMQLVEQGDAYPCFCTAERLEQMREEITQAGGTPKYDRHCADIPLEEAKRRMAAGEPYCIRQRLPQDGSTTFTDLLYGDITIENAQLDDGVLIKTDGMPTYNFANVIDDHLMEITHVLRGVEFISSTPKYNLLYRAFGWQAPEYIHLPPIMADSTRKLSKRHGDPSFEDLVADGYLVEAIINYIVLLGWSPGDDREFFTLEDLGQAFSLQGLSKHAPLFDREKLQWFNASYIRQLPAEEFLQRALPYAQDTVLPTLDAQKQHLVAELLQPRITQFNQLPEMLEACFVDLPDFDLALYSHKKMKTDSQLAATLLPIARTALQTAEWSIDGMKQALSQAAENAGVKAGQLLFTLRVALSGRASTPGGALELAMLVGRDQALARLDKQIARLQ